MSAACIIPIKANSVRVLGKNFKTLGGRPLYYHIVEAAQEAKCFDIIAIDSNSEEIKIFCEKNNIYYIDRLDWLASNEANGNDLLIHHKNCLPDYDYYFQLFATAPFLSPDTIRECCKILTSSNYHDSIFTATEECGWFWWQNQPINFRPGILPRSQDAVQVIKETTGLYGISKDSLERYNCRIGRNPYIHLVSDKEAIDIDTEEDFKYAEYLIGEE